MGKHEWVVSFDLNSLYPHIIMQYNISPEKMQRGLTDTSVEKLFNKETIVDGALGITPNGARFSNDKQGFLPELMQKFYDERKMWKGKMIGYQKELQTCTDRKRKNELNTLIKRSYNNQQVRKIALNSAYGAFGKPILCIL